MHDDVRRDLGDSAYEFQRAVWPLIRGACGDGDLIPVETMTDNQFAALFDQHAGIDAWQVQANCGIRGIASRVQWDDGRSGYPYCTFTVRHSRTSGTKTEYEKRCRAIREPERGWLYPHLTVQAFFSQPKRCGDLLACAVARTLDVVQMIANGHCLQRKTTNATFWVVPWDEMLNQKFHVALWRGSVRVDAADAGWHSVGPLHVHQARLPW